MKLIWIILLLFTPVCAFSQSRWHPFAGIHGSMDAGGYYVGASMQAGIDYKLEEKTVLSSYLQYFPKKINFKYDDGSFEIGQYKSLVIATLIQAHLSKRTEKGLFLGGGIAIQRTSEDYKSDMEEIHSKRTILVGAMRFGYLVNIKGQVISFEINALGPHKSKYTIGTNEVEQMELLTQLSAGIRIIF